MHNGHIPMLRGVVQLYSEICLSLLHLAHLYDSDGVPAALRVDKLLKPLKLTEQEIDDVAAFLETLTDKQAAAPRQRPPAKTATCRH